MLKYVLLLCVICSISSKAQNTATTSGNWSSCSTWGTPSAIFRNTTDTKTINNGVTVTADAVWSTGAIVMAGASAALNINSGIFVDFVNDQGADVACDKIYTALQSVGCASCSAYTSAASNKYVSISEAEYNAIKSQLSNITLVGASDTQMSLNTGISAGGPETLSIGTSQPKAPANSYAIAFSISFLGYTSTTGQIKIKYNTTGSANTGYADYGFGNFGTFPAATAGKYFYVIKNPSQATYSGGFSYMSYFCNVPGIMVTNNESSWVTYSADSNALNTAHNIATAFQVITSTVQQW